MFIKLEENDEPILWLFGGSSNFMRHISSTQKRSNLEISSTTRNRVLES